MNRLSERQDREADPYEWRFDRGRLIVHRNVRHGRVAWIRPVRVVQDDDLGLLLWLAGGTPVAYEVAWDGRGIRSMPFAEWVACGHRLAHDFWRGPGLLMFLPRGARHSVWWMRHGSGGFAGWYVNLEEPGMRWDDGYVAGVDIVDQDLDLEIPPDRTWRWKDEAELRERLPFGEHYWVSDPTAVLAEGERAVRRAEERRFPFDGTWCDFRPDPAWSVPTGFPPGCDRPPVPR